MSKITYRHAVENEICTRTSSRVYTHVVLIRRTPGNSASWARRNLSEWVVCNWCGSELLAAKVFSSKTRQHRDSRVEKINNGVAA